MLKEQLLPISIELSSHKGLRKLRAIAAINEQQIENLQHRLAIGTIRRFGEDRQLTPRQRQRREAIIKVLDERVREDVAYIRRVLPGKHIRNSVR